MAYEKTNWIDNETPINAENLNKIEQGIEDAEKTGGILAGSIIAWEEDTIPEGYDVVADYTLVANDYGTAKKFADGFMICTKTISFSNVAFNLQQGNLYFCSALELGRTAETFANIPRVFINVSNGWGLIAGARSQTVSSFGLTQLFRGDNTEQTTITLDLVAFGRWK